MYECCCTPPVQVEGKYVLLHHLLAHDVVEHWKHSIHRDPGVSHAEDAVKLCCDEGYSRLFDRFTKQLLPHRKVTDLEPKQMKSTV